MCIRDRDSEGIQNAPHWTLKSEYQQRGSHRRLGNAHGAREDPETSFRRARNAPWAASVSYTHLSYRKTDGTLVTDQALTAGSYVSSLRDAVRLGTEGNEVLFRLTPVVEEGVQSADECIQSMELKLVLARVPTLKSLRVENADGVVQAADQVFSPLTKNYTYKIVTTDHRCV